MIYPGFSLNWFTFSCLNVNPITGTDANKETGDNITEPDDIADADKELTEDVENMVERAWKACGAYTEEETEMDVFPPLPSSPDIEDNTAEGPEYGQDRIENEENVLEAITLDPSGEEQGQSEFFKSLFELDIDWDRNVLFTFHGYNLKLIHFPYQCSINIA